MTVMHPAHDPVGTVVDALGLAGKKVERRGDQYMAQCPAHADRTPSLSIARGKDGQALLHCFAGCSTGDILDTLGLPARAMFADWDGTAPTSVTHLRTVRAWNPDGSTAPPAAKADENIRLEKAGHYDYVWPDGSPCARIVRQNKIDRDTGQVVGKTFLQQRYEGDGYLNRIGDLKIPVYHADLVAAAVILGNPVWICEGEKDVDAVIAAYKVIATCNPGGAKKWRDHHTEALRGVGEVVIIADNDRPGREHSEKVRSALEGVVGSVTVRCAAVGKDISDHIAAGYTPDDLVDPDAAPLSEDVEPAGEAGWWGERPWLRHIHTFARSRMISPYALLAVALVRVVANTPPWVTLPAIIGGRGSLNLFCALVGPSGAGKSAVCSASDELLPWADHWNHIGSGEGLLHTYVTRTKVDDPQRPGKQKFDVDQHTNQATCLVDEIDTLTALGARQGSTLLPTLRSAWSGSSLGFGYADPSKRLMLKAHTYRLGLVVGAQPTRCEPMFDEADAGTPQRFIWAPLVDPNAPDDLPDNPGPLEQPRTWSGFQTQMIVPDVLVEAVTTARRVALRTGNTRGLDGHGLLNRVKVAAAVALMEGRIEISDDDWELSGRIQATSDSARAWVQRIISAERTAAADQRAAGRAREATVVDEAVTDARIGRIARVIARAVHSAGDDGVLRSEAQKKVAHRDRSDFEPGLQFALSAAWVTEIERPHSRTGEPVKVLVAGKEKP